MTTLTQRLNQLDLRIFATIDLTLGLLVGVIYWRIL